ncbi:hypothetical protein U1Q18_004972 [Sarracenia purpurea var. burkii]
MTGVGALIEEGERISGKDKRRPEACVRLSKRRRKGSSEIYRGEERKEFGEDFWVFSVAKKKELQAHDLGFPVRGFYLRRRCSRKEPPGVGALIEEGERISGKDKRRPEACVRLSKRQRKGSGEIYRGEERKEFGEDFWVFSVAKKKELQAHDLGFPMRGFYLRRRCSRKEAPLGF